MHIRNIAGILGVLVGVAGCTPFGENVLRKADSAGMLDSAKKDTMSSVAVAVPESFGDPATETFVRGYGPVIKLYANQYGLDWRLVLATVKQESRFSTTAESHQGAYGLMQLMPGTGEEVARALEVDDFTRPRNNIRAGMFYMRQLFDLFDGAEESDRIRLTLAAYNAGIGRIYDAQEMAAYLHENPLEWSAIRDMLPFLSRRYQSLHRSIWTEDKPRSGYFGNAGETLRYVDNVMQYYEEYQLMYN